LIDYLDATDPDLAALVRGTCVDLTLGSTKGKAGITLLIPDKEYRAKISKLAYSSDPAEASQACDMLNALILRDVFKSGADFMAKRANIPNSLYPSQHVGVKDVKGSTVTFESGAVATLDSGFADSSKKKNLAVWHLKGEIPVTSDKPAKIERGPSGRGPKGGKMRGGYDQGVATELSKNLRWKIAAAVENEYALCLLQRQVAGRLTQDPFVRCAMSLVEFLHDKAPDTLNLVLPLLSVSKADFYFLIEPHKDGDWTVPDAMIEEWWKLRASHSAGAGCKIIDELLAGKNGKQQYDENRKIAGALLQQCNDRNCVDKIEAAYNAKYKVEEEASLKLLQDELRFLIHCSFEELEAYPVYDGGKLGEIVNMIGEYMHKMTGSAAERKSGNKMLNAKMLKYAIAPSDKIDTIKCFINSTHFMFVPMTASEARSIPKSHTERPSPDVKGVWNIASANIQKYSTHHRLADGTTNTGSELEAVLKEVDPALADRIRAAVSK
jgi:hypothetical protein